jgi:hypothetical protein
MSAKKPKAVPNAITPAASDAFHLFIHKWRSKLNLMDWRVEKSPDPSRSSLAEIKSMSLKDRLAIYKLGADFGDTKPATEHNLEEIACHEMLHVLLHALIEKSKEAGASQDDIDSEEHRIINTLVLLLVPEAD